MAEPTFTGNPGRGPTVYIIDANTSAGEDLLTAYGFQNCIIYRFKDCDLNVSEVLKIFGTGGPHDDDTYDDAPRGSEYTDVDGSNDSVLFLRTAAAGQGANWAPVTNEADA